MQADKTYRTKKLGLLKQKADFDYDIQQQTLDEVKNQRRLGTLISAVGLPVSGYLGYKGMQKDLEEAALNRALAKKYLNKTPWGSSGPGGIGGIQ